MAAGDFCEHQERGFDWLCMLKFWFSVDLPKHSFWKKGEMVMLKMQRLKIRDLTKTIYLMTMVSAARATVGLRTRPWSCFLFKYENFFGYLIVILYTAWFWQPGIFHRHPKYDSKVVICGWVAPLWYCWVEYWGWSSWEVGPLQL
jgi:hypothetical protein